MSGGMSVVIKFCFSDNCLPVCVLCRLCAWGYFRHNLWLQTGALVRCRYQNFAGFLSQTSDFPHTFPHPGLKKEKKKLKCNNKEPVGQRASQWTHRARPRRGLFSLHTELQCVGPGGCSPALRCFAACSGLWAVKTTLLFVQQRKKKKKKDTQLLGSLQNQLDLPSTFTSAFLPDMSTGFCTTRLSPRPRAGGGVLFSRERFWEPTGISLQAGPMFSLDV